MPGLNVIVNQNPTRAVTPQTVKFGYFKNLQCLVQLAIQLEVKFAIQLAIQLAIQIAILLAMQCNAIQH